MVNNILKSLENALITDNFKEIYINLLKIFNKIKNEELNSAEIHNLIGLLAKYKDSYLINNKKEKVENEISQILNKNLKKFDIINFDFNRTNLFFKKQIKDLISRNFELIFCLLPEFPNNPLLLELILHLINNLELNLISIFYLTLEYFNSQKISKDLFYSIFNLIFDKSPKEILNILFIHINRLSLTNIDEDLIRFYYEILVQRADIYPEIFIEEIDVLLLKFFEEINQKKDISLIIGKILLKLVDNRSDLFIKNFFFMINKLIKKSNIDYKIEYLIDSILKKIYLHNSYELFNYFYINFNDNFGPFLQIFKSNNNLLKETLLEFLLDYLKYEKTFIFNGKISAHLLDNYLILLNFFYENSIYNEFFILSVISQLELLELKEYNLYSHKGNTDYIKNLKLLYKKVIRNLKEFKSIIFNE
ncbi:MAG: hypothetical protein ACTSQP_14685 [Promethearchaeota archaeon]